MKPKWKLIVLILAPLAAYIIISSMWWSSAIQGDASESGREISATDIWVEATFASLFYLPFLPLIILASGQLIIQAVFMVVALIYATYLVKFYAEYGNTKRL